MKNHGVFRFVTVLMIVIMLSSMAVAGFAAEEEQITLRFMWLPMEDSERQAWDECLFNPFMKEHPNIKIEFEGVQNEYEVAKVQLAAGAGPDIFQPHPSEIRDFYEADMLADLTPYVEKYGWDKYIFDWAMDATKVDGKQVALPHSYEGTVLWYNKDLLDSHGWPIPQTREEFEMVCNAAQEAGLIAISAGYADSKVNDHWVISDYLGCYCGTDTVEKLLRAELKFTDEPIKAAFHQYYEDWQKGWYNEKEAYSIGFNDMNALWLQQRAVFNPNGTWFSFIFPEVSFNFGCVPWPSMRDGVEATMPMGLGAALGVNKNSPHVDEACEFLDFMYSRTDLIAKSISMGMQGLCRAIDPSLYPADMDSNMKNMLKVMDEASETGHTGYVLWTFYPPKTTVWLGENMANLMLDQLTLDQFCEEAQKCFDEDLADGWVFPMGK